jgi:hypothetical protein
MSTVEEFTLHRQTFVPYFFPACSAAHFLWRLSISSAQHCLIDTGGTHCTALEPQIQEMGLNVLPFSMFVIKFLLNALVMFFTL